MTEEQIARVKEPITYFMVTSKILNGHTPSNKRTVFSGIDDKLIHYSVLSPSKTVAIFRVTKWKTK